MIGCGAVGLSAVQGARIAGQRRSTRSTSTSGSWRRRGDSARRTPARRLLDFVFDVVGRPETVTQGLEMLGHAGTLVYIGLPQPGVMAALDLNEIFDRRARILVSHGGDHFLRRTSRGSRWASTASSTSPEWSRSDRASTTFHRRSRTYAVAT